MRTLPRPKCRCRKRQRRHRRASRPSPRSRPWIQELQDPAAREGLVQDLELLVEARQGDAPARANATSATAEALKQIGGNLATLSNELVVAAALEDLPAITNWLTEQWREPDRRSLWLAVLGNLALTIGLGYGAQVLMRLALLPARRRLAQRPPRQRWLRLPLLAAIAFVIRVRKPIGRWIRGRAGTDGTPGEPREATALSDLRARAAAIWYVPALLYLVRIYGIWALQAIDGAERLLWGTLLTVATIVVAVAVGRLADRAICVALSPDGERLPLRRRLRRQLQRWQTPLRFVTRWAVRIVALLLILQAWGVPSFAWLAAGAGRTIAVSTGSVLLTLLLALALWEGATLGIASYLAEHDDQAGRAPAQRARTLLAVARTALLVLLSVVTALILLSELGIDIAPMLAAAGALGLQASCSTRSAQPATADNLAIPESAGRRLAGSGGLGCGGPAGAGLLQTGDALVDDVLQRDEKAQTDEGAGRQDRKQRAPEVFTELHAETSRAGTEQQLGLMEQRALPQQLAHTAEDHQHEREADPHRKAVDDGAVESGLGREGLSAPNDRAVRHDQRDEQAKDQVEIVELGLHRQLDGTHERRDDEHEHG